MKVYARYFEDNDLGFRRDTILQFGNSWDVIGSIILINPGSASPSNEIIETQILDELSKLTKVDDKDSWKEFSVDPTMYQIEKLFNGYYIGKNKTLNGVIQLFNLFNLRNANLSQALELFKTTKNPNIMSIEHDIKQIGSNPVYIGWGNAGKHNLKDIAEKTFNELPKQPYLLDKFLDNPFYHPRFLQMSFKRNGRVIKLLHDFYNQNREYLWDGVVAESIQLDYNVLQDNFIKLITTSIDSSLIELKLEEKTVRVFFTDSMKNIMEFTVTIQKGKEYTTLRYKSNSQIVKDNSVDYITLGDQIGLNPTDDYINGKNGNWLLRSSLNSFADNEQAIAEKLLEALQSLLAMS